MTTRRRIPAVLAVVAATLAVAAPSALARATDGTISGAAGNGVAGFAGDGGPAPDALLDTPNDVAFVSSNSYLIADFNNNRIRQVMPNGNILTVAGSDAGSFGDGGPAVDAGLDHPEGVTSIGGGVYLIADTRNDEIRRVGADGIITTIAGGPVQGLAGDGGPATLAQLSLPSDTAPMADGSILIADTGNDRIRRIAPNGIISTIAGTTRGFSGDGGPATAAQLNQPRDIAVASDGSILIADTGNNRIRRIALDGIISTVAGNGVGFGGDGDPAHNARLDAPTSIAPLAHGGFLVADSANNRIRRITPLGAIFTVAGTAPGNAGNGGLAKTAQLNHPGAITPAPNGGFLVADTANSTVRSVSDIGAVPPAVVGHSVGVAPAASGVVVKPKGMNTFLPLKEEDLVPTGSQVDATTGQIDLSVAKDTGGVQQTARLFFGSFTVTQPTLRRPTALFQLPAPTGCPRTKKSSAPVASAAAKKKKKKHKKKRPPQKRLWVTETGGNWKTATGSVSAGAIGTEWLTTSLCDGTRVTVRKGIVRVRDRHKHITLRAGQTYRTHTR
jgi:NHL repeat